MNIKSQLFKDTVLILFLLIISYFAVYHSPNIVRAIILSGIVFYFVKSKDNVPWVIFFFLYLSSPATLFYTGSEKWFFFLTSRVGIEYSVIISFAFLIKGIINRNNIKNRFLGEGKLFYFYFIVLFFIGLIHGGFDFKNGFIFFKSVPTHLLILFLPVLIDMHKDYDRLKKLLYVFTIFLFIIQLLEVVLNRNLFGAGKLYIVDDLQRNISGIVLVFFTLIIVISDLLFKKSENKFLVILTSIAAIFLIINSGTRGWMLASAFIVIGLLIVGNKVKTVAIALSSIGFLVVFLVLGPGKYINNLSGSFDRLYSVFLVLEGNESAGGPRLTTRLPRVMNHFWENPIFGLGISDEMFEYFDGHVANASLLLQCGIVGFTVLYIVILSILWKVFLSYLSLGRDNIYRVKILAMIIGCLGMFVIHFTSRQVFGFWMRGDTALLFGFWFLFTFYYMDKAKQYERI